jgi:hypothetical protein
LAPNFVNILLFAKYNYNYKVEEDEVGEACGRNGREEERVLYRLLVGKPEGKRPLGRPGRRRINNIKMGLLEIGLNVVDWIGLAQDRYRWREPL